LSMGNEGSSEEVMAKVSAQFERIVSAPKFKRCKVSTIWDFLPSCGRVTTPKYRS
ncbi:hypothetical protein J1N35_043824, partial [Gossypium stocksii]